MHAGHGRDPDLVSVMENSKEEKLAISWKKHPIIRSQQKTKEQVLPLSGMVAHHWIGRLIESISMFRVP